MIGGFCLFLIAMTIKFYENNPSYVSHLSPSVLESLLSDSKTGLMTNLLLFSS